jgi:hypothetical protein
VEYIHIFLFSYVGNKHAFCGILRVFVSVSATGFQQIIDKLEEIKILISISNNKREDHRQT